MSSDSRPTSLLAKSLGVSPGGDGSGGSSDGPILYVLWRPDLEACGFQNNFHEMERATSGDVGGSMNVNIHAKQWLDYKVELITPMMDYYFPWLQTGLWKCHITYTRAEMVVDEVRVHEEAGIIPDSVATAPNGIDAAGYGFDLGTPGQPRFGEQEYFTCSLGNFHFYQPAYMDALSGWGTFVYHPDLHPQSSLEQSRFPNGNYTVTAKVRYRLVHADFIEILDIDAPGLFNPGGGDGSGGGGILPSGPSGGTFSPKDVLLPGMEPGDGYDWTPVTAPWQNVELTAHVNLSNLVIDKTMPENPTPVVWDPDTMTEFPLKLHMQSAYASNRIVEAVIFNAQGQGVQTLRKAFKGQSDTVDFHWNGWQTDFSGSPTVQLPPGLYFFTCNAHLPEYDEWGDKSQFMQVRASSPEASQVSDDGQTATYELKYWIACNANFVDEQNRPPSEGVIDVYGPDLTKIYSHTMTTAELALGQHTTHLSMPTLTASGVYTFVIAPKDDYADLDKRHLCQFPTQATQTFIKWRLVSGTDVNTPGAVYFPVTNTVPFTSVTVIFSTFGVLGSDLSFQLHGLFTPGSTTHFTWDSTRFPDGAKLVVRTVTAGITAPKVVYVQVYNHGAVLVNDHIKLAREDKVDARMVDIAEALKNPMNYHTPVYTSTTDVKATILNNLREQTVLYINTHGGSRNAQGSKDRFLDCVAAGSNVSDMHRIFVPDVRAAVKRKHNIPLIGVLSGYKIPPFNFVHLDGCEASKYPDFAQAFGVDKTDKGLLGWITKVNGGARHDRWTHIVWTQLANGSTLGEAEKEAKLQVPGLRYTLKHTNAAGEEVEEYYPAESKVWGDKSMKMHGVYGGNGLAWHNP